MYKFIYLMLLPVVLAGSMSMGGRNGMSIGGRQGMSMGGRNGMSMGQEKSYVFHSTPATFEEAKAICRQDGGSLAVITSQEEEDKMLKLWKGPVENSSNGCNYQAFIGIHSLNQEGHWETIDGTSLQYVNWSPNWTGRQQPDNPDRQKCGSLLKKGGMDDYECYFKIAFFCEK